MLLKKPFFRGILRSQILNKNQNVILSPGKRRCHMLDPLILQNKSLVCRLFGLTIFLFIIFYFKILNMYGQPQGGGRFPSQQHQQQTYQGYHNQQPGAPQYRQNYQGNMNAHGQGYVAQQEPIQNAPRGSHASNYTGGMKNAALMQPPALNAEEPMDTNSQFFHQRGPMTMSNNQHSQFDTYHQQEEDPMWTQQAQIASMFWEQRCMTMLERFEWFYQRFQILRNDHLTLSEEMQRMDSEEEWHVFQQHHEEFHQKIDEMEQELSAVLGENEQLLQQRQTQDSQGVWEQRYQELLGNFKSLQEEMAHMQSSGGRGGVPPQQYQQLQEHCAELEYQYQQAFNELKMHREGGLSPQIENQMHAYMDEIENYKEKLNTLHSENVELQKMLEDFQGENEQLKQEKYRSTVDRNKFEELIRQVELKEQEIQSLQEDFKNRAAPQVNTSQYERAIQERDHQIDELSRLLNEKSAQLNQIAQSHSKLQQLESSTRLKAKKDLQQEKRNQQRRIAEYQQKIAQLKSELNNSDQSTKVQHLQKKLSYSNQEITNLNDTLKKKNQELIELRSLTYQVEKLKQAQGELMRAADERDRLADTLRKKGAQIVQMHQEIERLSGLINEQSSKRQEYSTRNLRAQIEDLTDQLRRSQGEINRVKSVVALKEQYTAKLEEELRQARQKLVIVEQLLQSEREGWHERQVRLNAKSHDYGDKIRALDYEFNLQMKDTLEREVNSLRKQNAERLDAIRALQEKQLILSSQLSVYQKQQDNYNKDLSLQKEKEKSLLANIESQAKRFRQLQERLKRKDEQILLSQQKIKQVIEESSSLRLQIQEHQSLIKAKSKSIKQLQEQLTRSISRQSQNDKLALQNARLQMAIQALEREKAQQESSLAKSKGLSVNKSKKQIELHQNMLMQLSRENEYLRQEIGKLISKNAENNIYTSKDSRLIPFDVNRRLNEFSNKLQDAICNHGGQLSRTQSQKTVLLWERERNQLINHYENVIKSLKQQIDDRKLGGSQLSNDMANSKKIFISGLQSQSLKDQNAFLKQKLQEQQQRNKHLISVNEDLRGKIDSMLKIKQNSTTLNYYKQELQRAETEKEALKERLRKAAEQIRQYKLQLTAKNTKLTQEYQFKVTQLEILLQEQIRKISLLQGEKAAANNQKATLQHQQNIRSLNRNPTPKVDEVVNGTTPKSNHYKSGIQQQFGSVLGNLSGYESPKGSVNIAASGVRIQGSRYQYRNDER